MTYLGLRIVGAMEVGCVFLLETLATALWEVIIIVENTPSCICGQMDLTLLTQVS